MQPRFPADHHFHRRTGTRHGSPRAADMPALTDHAAAYLARKCLPAFDPSDPRATPPPA